MKKSQTQSVHTIVIMGIILFVIVTMFFLIFFSNVEFKIRCSSNADCMQDEVCVGEEGISNLGVCMNQTNTYYALANITRKNITTFKYFHPNDNKTYCYPDNTKGNHCTCDILFYPDGHNESVNCKCYNDLLMYYTCINLTEKNMTVKINMIYEE